MKPLAFAALLAGVSTAVQAAPDRYTFDKQHTHILFFVDHLGFSSTVGRIRDYDGYFTFDEKTPEKSEVEVTLNPASIDTNVAALDKTLQGEKFLDVARYPSLHFKSTAVTVTGEREGDLQGELTLLGKTRPVTLHVTYNRSGIHPYTNNYVSGFTAAARFKRSDFGMVSYLPDVGDEVRVHIEVEGINPFRHPGRHDKKSAGASQ